MGIALGVESIKSREQVVYGETHTPVESTDQLEPPYDDAMKQHAGAENN